MRKPIYIFGLVVLLLLAFPLQRANAQGNENVKQLLKMLEEDTDRFTKSLDNALDKSSLNGTKTEDEINGYVHDFEEATDRLKDRYEDRGTAPNAAREVYRRAGYINSFMRRYRLGPQAETDWQKIKRDLEALGRAFRFKVRW